MGKINAINCNKENLGLGVVECEQFLSEFKTPILIRKNWSMTKTAFEALTAADFVELVQNGDWQPVTGSKAFTNNTPDVTTEEFSGGVMAVVRNAKPDYTFDYNKGVAFHKALYSKNTFGTYNIGIVDGAGNLVLALSADGTRVTGLTAGMVNTATYTPQSGDASANTSFRFQLTNEDQFNRRMAVYTVDQSGVDFNEELMPIIGVSLIGTAGATTASITVNAVNNVSFGIEGLDETNFIATNTTDNSEVTILTAAEGAAGVYTLTYASQGVGDKLVFKMYDTANDVDVALIAPNQLYKGESAEITVTA